MQNCGMTPKTQLPQVFYEQYPNLYYCIYSIRNTGVLGSELESL